MCRLHADCTGVVEDTSVPLEAGRFEMRSGNYLPHAGRSEIAHTWCGPQDRFHPHEKKRRQEESEPDLFQETQRGPLSQPDPAFEAYTFARLRYWRHGVDDAVVKWTGPRPVPDRSWLPPQRKHKFFLANVDSGGFNNIRLAFEVVVV